MGSATRNLLGRTLLFTPGIILLAYVRGRRNRASETALADAGDSQGLDASQYITLEDATEFLGQRATMTRKAGNGGPYPIGMCIYDGGAGLSLQVVVQKNVRPEAFQSAMPAGATPVKNMGDLAYWTRVDGEMLPNIQLIVLKDGVKLHLYTRKPTTLDEMRRLALKGLERVH